MSANVDLRALTLSLDSIFVTSIAVQVALCIYLLIRSISRPLPIQPAVLVLLGGLILHLASYATILAEDVRKRNTTVPYGRLISVQSSGFQITEGLLGTFGYIAVLTSVLLMIYQSGVGNKNERRTKMVVVGGILVLLAILGLSVANAVNSYLTNLAFLRQGISALEASFYSQRGLLIASPVLSAVLIVVLALAGFPNSVHPLRNAILFGLIPAHLVQIILSAINLGLYYSQQHNDILINPAYIYSNSSLSKTAAVIIPACVLYVGYGWTRTDPSYKTQSSVEDMDRKP